jgi:hypothetical protein
MGESSPNLVTLLLTPAGGKIHLENPYYIHTRTAVKKSFKNILQ